MNHLRDLLDTPAERWLIDCSDRDAFAVFGDVQKYGRQAMCFWLGEVEELSGVKIIPELVRMPYDVCWFEVACTTLERTWVIGMLAINTPETTRLVGFRKMRGVWELRYVADAKGGFNASQMRVLADHEDALAAREVMVVRQHVAAFLSALHCSNVVQQRHEPNEKLQRARAKRGKAPLFSYWTLQLNGKSEREESQGGTHASPRVHLRRGHPREYAPGLWTWVQPHVVGNRQAGMVHKDYSAGRGLRAA